MLLGRGHQARGWFLNLNNEVNESCAGGDDGLVWRIGGYMKHIALAEEMRFSALYSGPANYVRGGLFWINHVATNGNGRLAADDLEHLIYPASAKIDK